jgi:type II secretory pathway pseudopilin PulG
MTPRRFQMNSRPATRSVRPRGFSLLEALIAVVVLSTGLLALAALQSAMIRSSVDARIRSSASAAAVAVLEDLRAGGYQAILTGTGIPVDMATENYIVPDPAVVGGFTITYNSQAWFDNGGTFTPTLPTGAPPLAEFKKIDITVGWTDPYGSGQRSLVFTDLVGPLGASLTSPDLSQLGSTLNNQRPIVITKSPEGPGVIPIAVGDGQDTAATNPKPVIVSQGNKSAVIETRFDVLNFSSGGEDFPDDFVRIQKRVETSIVGCTCQFGATGALTGVFSEQFRPTFWDGTRYAPPKVSGTAAPAGPKPSGQGNNTVIQSELCTDCCRDHHDPSGVQGAKFDPFRASAHTHFNLSNGNLNAVSSGDYIEACRLIRVDGLWRVATDMHDDFFGLLKTTTVAGKAAADPVPDPATTPIYEEFVIDALKSRFVAGTPLNAAGLASLYDSKGLNAPTTIDIALSAGDSRWLHARGFFVDFIEPEAQQVIDEARTNCPVGTPAESCVLPFVPFTTINMTELATWSRSANSLRVSLGTATLGIDPRNPLRGQVDALLSNPNLADAIATARVSNSGLLINPVDVTQLPLPVDPEDRDQQLTDRQTFRVSASGTP